MPEERTDRVDWVVVHLENRLYALPLDRVVEVVRLVALEPVPHAAPELTGLMNYRGRPVAVLDLRRKLGLAPGRRGLDTLILVVESLGRTVGLLAGEEVEVLSLVFDALEASIDVGEALPVVRSVGRAGDRLVLVLDLDRLVGAAGRPILSDQLHGAEHAVTEPR